MCSERPVATTHAAYAAHAVASRLVHFILTNALRFVKSKLQATRPAPAATMLVPAPQPPQPPQPPTKPDKPARATANQILFPEEPFGAISSPARDDPTAIHVRKTIAIKIYSVHAEMCGSSAFTSRNIFVCGAAPFLVHPCCDSMGVASTACEIIRMLYSGNGAHVAFSEGDYLNLSIDCRVKMAAALFLAYKIKSEDTWNAGSRVAQFILGRFVTTREFSTQTMLSKMAAVLTKAEFEILQTLQIHRLSEYNLAALFDYKLTHLLQQELITPLAASMCISVSSFYINFFRCVTQTEFLETMCEKFGIDSVALSLLVVATSTLMSSFIVDFPNIPKSSSFTFDEVSVRLGGEMLKNRIECHDHGNDGYTSLCSKSVAKSALSVVSHSIQKWEQ